MVEHSFDPAVIREIGDPSPYIEVKNVFDETVSVRVMDNKGRNAWRHRLLTTNCSTCPFYIGSEQAIPIIGSVKRRMSIENKGWKSPVDPQGICIYRSDQPRILARKEHDLIYRCGNTTARNQGEKVK